jgi:hypothetical protein
MSLYRLQARARLEDGMTERRVDGSGLQLVTVCLTDEGAGEISDAQGTPLAPEPPVLSHLRPSRARELAFCLLELAELAERRSEVEDARA